MAGLLVGAADLGDALNRAKGCSGTPACGSGASHSGSARQLRGRRAFSGTPAQRQHSSGACRPVAVEARKQSSSDLPLRDPEARFRR